MYQFAENYSDDLGPARYQRLPSWYDSVRRIPYQSDDDLFSEFTDRPDDIVELVARPKYLMDRRLFPALDCKKKAILIGAWAKANDIPFAFVAVSEYPDKHIHHVLPLLCLDGEWITADATFPKYSLGQDYDFTRVEELRR